MDEDLARQKHYVMILKKNKDTSNSKLEEVISKKRGGAMIQLSYVLNRSA